MALSREARLCIALVVSGVIYLCTVPKIHFHSNLHQTLPSPYNAHLRHKSPAQAMLSDFKSESKQGRNKDAYREVVLHPENETCQHRLPKCIIIGIPKSVTSALLKFLGYHPQIAATLDPEEPGFFNHHYEQGLDWYKKIMACSYSNQITIEKTPGYFYSLNFALRIKAMDKNIKLLIVVKDPVKRALSHYAMRVRIGHTKNTSFRDMIISPKTGQINQRHIVMRWSTYTPKLKEWLEIFSRGQIHIVDGLAMEKNPAKELRKVEDFLQIGTYFTEDRFVFNKTKGKYCFIGNLGIECLGNNKGSAHPNISQEFLLKLKEHFHEMNEQFFELIGQRFDWGY